MELVIASAIFLVALATFFAGLARNQQSASYATHQNRALDELRHTANVFAKDARQASAVSEVSGSKITMTTTTGDAAAPTTVTYEVVNQDGALHLERREGAATQRFIVDLTDADVFDAGTDLLDDVKTIDLQLTTDVAQHQPVSLSTEVTLRNAGG